jgi:putative DNA primase/helicase
MSPSSVEVIYQPKGAGKKPRSAVFDLDLIADPQNWLTARIGPLASFTKHPKAIPVADATAVKVPCTLPDLSLRLTASMENILCTRRAALNALSLRLAAHKPNEITNPENGE